MATGKRSLKRAILWGEAEDRGVKCGLCSWRCLIADGKMGRCGVRQNIGGVLYSLNYDRVCAANVDPIEKKPLFHFQPGSKSFSISAAGCNFQCVFCQNWQISQMALEKGNILGQSYLPEEIVKSALDSGCRSIAYTYTEPTIFMELCGDCGLLAHESGLANVFVSNGYQSREAIDFAAGWLDGINIDLKSFSDDYYKRLCKVRLGPVLDTIRYIAANTNIWMEITTLIVPGENDSDEEFKQIADFIVEAAGPDTPWHVSRFYPNYEMDDKLPTDGGTLARACKIGKSAGLRYVYVGNLPGARAEFTDCYSCGKILIERVGYAIGEDNIDNGCCPDCGVQIAGFEL